MGRKHRRKCKSSSSSSSSSSDSCSSSSSSSSSCSSDSESTKIIVRVNCGDNGPNVCGDPSCFGKLANPRNTPPNSPVLFMPGTLNPSLGFKILNSSGSPVGFTVETADPAGFHVQFMIHTGNLRSDGQIRLIRRRAGVGTVLRIVTVTHTPEVATLNTNIHARVGDQIFLRWVPNKPGTGLNIVSNIDDFFVISCL